MVRLARRESTDGGTGDGGGTGGADRPTAGPPAHPRTTAKTRSQCVRIISRCWGCWPASDRWPRRFGRGSRCCSPTRSTSWPASASRCSPTRRRSEEHTSELQSLAYLVCRLLLEKKKKKKN